MSTRQPVNRAARRAFWPSRPIASESWSSGTITVACLASSSTSTSRTRAGESAFATKRAGSSLCGMMSIFSPRSSETTMRTREPRGATQAPTGSTPSACDTTAIFERWPGSGATLTLSTKPSATSRTSSSNGLLIRSGAPRAAVLFRLRPPLGVYLGLCGLPQLAGLRGHRAPLLDPLLDGLLLELRWQDQLEDAEVGRTAVHLDTRVFRRAASLLVRGKERV